MESRCEAWRDANPCPALGGKAYLLSPSHQASHLLFQAGHDFSQDYLFLYQLLDLAMVIEKSGLRSEALLGEVKGLNLSSRSLLERFLRAVEEVFFHKDGILAHSEPTQAIIKSLFCSALAPKEKVFFINHAGLPALSLREKVLLVLGYFFLNRDLSGKNTGPGCWLFCWAGRIIGAG